MKQEQDVPSSEAVLQCFLCAGLVNVKKFNAHALFKCKSSLGIRKQANLKYAGVILPDEHGDAVGLGYHPRPCYCNFNAITSRYKATNSKTTLPISSSSTIQDAAKLKTDMETSGMHSGVAKKLKANVVPHLFECQDNAAPGQTRKRWNDDGAVASTSKDFRTYDKLRERRDGLPTLNKNILIGNTNQETLGSQEPSTSAQIDISDVKTSLEEDSEVDVPDVPELLPERQPTPVDEPTIKIEIQEEPLKIEEDSLTSDIDDDLLTSDIHEEPILPVKLEEPSEEPDRVTSETVDQLDESERQSIHMFFDSLSRTVMTLPPSFVSRIKLEVLRVVTDMEMEAYEEKNQQSKEPSRKPDDDTAASEQAEPRIKIEIEDEEAEALNEPEEPESLDPDHDVNYEPLPKKKKKSNIEQPPSSSTSSVDRTPRTLHEPLETFFQSIAYTVTSFPPPLVCKAKVAVLNVVSKIQVEACRSQQSGCQDGGGGADNSMTRRISARGSVY